MFSGLPGELLFRYGGTYVDKNVSIAPATRPRDTLLRAWRWNANITYRTERFTADLQARYIGEGKYDNEYTEGVGAANTINDN